jgi:hypothetical protein
MSDESGRKARATAGPSAPIRSSLSEDEVRAFAERAPRCKVSVAVVCAPAATGETLDAELVNVSQSGMLVATANLLDVGTEVAFQFTLDDGVVALSGSAEVMRVSDQPPGLGLRFVSLDEAGQILVARLVEIALEDGGLRPPESVAGGFGNPPRVPNSIAAETSEPVGGAARAMPAEIEYGHGSVRIRLSRATARYFTYNPLLHIGVGGCFLPVDRDVPLGAGYQVDICDDADRLLLRCKAKVAAKQEGRIGLRLIDVERPALQALRAHIASLSPSPASNA